MKNTITGFLQGAVLDAGDMCLSSKKANTPSASDSFLSYTWEGVNFEYPGDWTLEEGMYRAKGISVEFLE